MLRSRTSARPAGRHRAPGSLLPRLGRLLASTALAVGGTAALAAPAEATVPHDQRHRVIDVAAAQAGDPYVWGVAGPGAFDCSGLTQYAYSKIGKYLPHNSAAQLAYTTRVPASQRWHGDLIFFYDSSGRVYHVAIYAGNGMMWSAPRTGDVVRKRPIYTTRVWYGHVK